MQPTKMIAEPLEVWVYQYIYWDDVTQQRKTSEKYATLEAIRNGLGVPLHTTGRKVALAEVPNGMYVQGSAGLPDERKNGEKDESPGGP